MSKLICISGPTGIGKTSLLKHIDEMLGQNGFWACYTVTEPLKDNHIFKLIKEDSKYMYPNQIEFLVRFLDSYRENSLLEKTIVRDRCIEEVKLFTELNYSLGSIGQKDYESFVDIYNKLTLEVQKPDYVFILDAPVDEIFVRIKQRGRGEEESISHWYLRELRKYYLETLPTLLPKTEIIRVPWSDSVPKNERYRDLTEKLIDIV